MDHHLVCTPFDGRENPELEVIDTHLAVYQVDDLHRQHDRRQLDHKEPPFVAANHGNDRGGDNYGNEHGINELRVEARHTTNLAYDRPDSFLFLFEALQRLLEITDFVVRFFLLPVHTYSLRLKNPAFAPY
jgi:hypothetical protein